MKRRGKRGEEVKEEKTKSSGKMRENRGEEGKED